MFKKNYLYFECREGCIKFPTTTTVTNEVI